MLLIITGCICVNTNTPYVVIRDTYERLQDYLNTIRWAIEETDFTDIIFGDNSNYICHIIDDMERMKALAQKRGKSFEYYSFQGDSHTVAMRGKGYGEGEILAYLYKNSTIMRKSECYYKLTGRLTIENIEKIHLSDKAENTFIFDVGMRSVDTRFYKLKMKDYISYFLDAHCKVNEPENKILEYVYYSVLTENHLPFIRFNRSLEFRGKSGSSGTEYKNVYHENILMELVHNSFLYRTYWGRTILRYVRRIKVK